MTKRTTIADVAKLAGVHAATVSRALNESTRSQVNATTARRVRQIATDLGYIPNIMARSLRTSLSMTVGVIIPDLTNPIFPPMVRGIENILATRGYTALIANTDDTTAQEASVFESLLARRVDGFIMATRPTEHPLVTRAYERDIRIVMLNRGTSTAPYPLVTADDATGIRAAVDHLLDLGHTRLLHLAGPANFTTSHVRADAFLAECRNHPSVTATVVESPALSIEAGRSLMDNLVDSGQTLPTAVIAGNDLLALGVLRSLRAHGLNCPDDMSVVGFNDMLFAEDFRPALTTVHVPYFHMGLEAGRLLLDEITGGEHSAVTVTLPVSLVIRDSTRAPLSA